LGFRTISNFVGNCTGRSPGFSPRRMRFDIGGGFQDHRQGVGLRKLTILDTFRLTQPAHRILRLAAGAAACRARSRGTQRAANLRPQTL
jgi:hypothetical protein